MEYTMETFIKKAIEKLNKNSESTLSDKDKKKYMSNFQSQESIKFFGDKI